MLSANNVGVIVRFSLQTKTRTLYTLTKIKRILSVTLINSVSFFFLSFFLSIFTGSLIHEHYTRECEFGNFDKIKTKQHKKKHTQKKHKNFWLNFCLNKECPKLLCGLGICHRRRQTIPMWNSSGEKRILQGITVCLVSAVLSTM